MCGIVGYCGVGKDENIHSDLKVASQRMKRRGPDAEGYWQGDGIVLAHRRLSVIDVTAGADQPLSTADGRLTIVFNGEIYNFRRLRKELECCGVRFRTASDTEVLLQLYEMHGVGMFKHIRGMYSFAIWDNVRRELLLARDPLGIKPLYIRWGADGLWFASQVRALCHISTGKLHEDAAGRVGFFLWGHVPEPFTLFKEIQSFPAGEAWIIGQKGLRRRHEFFHGAELFRGDGERGPLRESLLHAVRDHLEADVDVGVFLSSGQARPRGRPRNHAYLR